ncbi:helix-turn-helix domain-containing protein [Tamilnaduibacter salinus]|uniref:helix-turn-helix domain-containing protein n=1 Tax=Tamilnaduibacter salinus TaxID=1484056 RepID=UPI001FAEF638|nr:helix-turn-helix domain-containing protein [Tamilnaduibacter salinus]
MAAGVSFPWERKQPEYKREDFVLAQNQISQFDGWEMESLCGDAFDELVSVVDRFASPAPVWVPECLEALRSGRVPRTIPLSERSVRRKLAETTGAPPSYWRSLARVRQAGLALVQSDAPLASIAADFGFSDQPHMSREIRRWFGLTPLALRDNREQAIRRLTAPDVFQGPQVRSMMY